jgi:hypothetical protein
MEVNKNGLLFSYIDSLEDSNLFSKYKIKKIPSLNKYAENYLADLNKMKSYNYTNNDSIENYNDYNTSVKDFSNDTSKETNIQANQLSKLNDNFTTTKSDETNEIENNLSTKIKTINNLEIEHLKKNFNFNKTRIEDIASKNKNFDNNLTNFGVQQIEKYTLKKYNKRNKNVISELYKKISSPHKKKLNSIIFSDCKNGHYKNMCQLYKRKNNLDFSNLSKSQISSNCDKNNEIANNFFYKGNSDYTIKTKIKTKLSSFLNRNILTKYLYSERNKFKNNNNNSTSKNNNQLQNNFSESHTEDSFAPYNSISYRCNQNKSVTHSMEDYWKEKELKKRIKLDKLRKEKIYKENCELRDRPKIDENS